MTRLTEQQKQLLEDNFDRIECIAAMAQTQYGRAMNYDELLSCASMGAVQAAARFDPKGEASFRTWVSMRAKGAIQDELRRRRKEPRNKSLADARPACHDVKRTELKDECRSFLKHLDPTKQLLLKLLFMEEMDPKEVAQAIGYCERYVYRDKRELLGVY